MQKTMYIDEIKIDCFKTFGVPTSLGSFVPGINILVGCNGAGKTSIIDAIELIFDEEFDKVQDKKFDELVCHNTLKKSKNFINVEIIFNNSNPTDNEFPAKFSMQRKLGRGMDSYFLDKKKMSRKEFIGKICNAKIDMSVVRQGKVTKFATSSNKERLELFFKMISYAKYANQGKQQRWNTSVEARNNTMVEVNQCYDKLKEEHRVCEEFQKILRKKEWIIYGMEKNKLAEMKREIKQLEEKFGSWMKRQNDEKPRYFKLKSELEMLESKLMEKNRLFQSLENTEKTVKSIIERLEKRKRELEVSIPSRKQNKEEQEDILGKMNEKLEALEKDIASEEGIIQSMKSELSSVSTCVKELEVKYGDELWELDCLQRTLSEDQPGSKEARNKSTRENIEVLRKSIKEKREYLEQHLRQKEKRNQKVVELVDKISSVKSEIDKLKTSRKNHSEELNTLDSRIKIATDLSRVVAASIDEATEKIRLLENDHKQNCKKLSSAVKFDVMYNKTAVENALELFNKQSTEKIDVSSYHGFAVDCFQCDEPDLEAAVLAVAGRYLFNFVFDHGKDAVKILQIIDDEVHVKTMNLDILLVPKTNLPKIDDAFPLTKHIKYDPAYKKLVQFMFGNVMVCRDTKAASSLCKQKNITCVTTNGSVFFPGGVSEGGNWNENERNRIQIYRSISRLSKEIKNAEEEKDKYSQKHLSFTTTISESLESKETLKLKNEHNEQQMMLLRNELDTMEYELQCNTVDDDEHGEIVNSIGRLNKRLEELKLKLNRNDQDEMTAKEYQRYEELKVSTADLFKLLKEEGKKADELNRKITLQLDVLEETLLKTKDHLQEKIEKTVEETKMEVDLIKKEGWELKRNVEVLESEYKKLKEVEKMMNKTERAVKEKEDLKKQKEAQVFKLKINVDQNNIDMKALEAERDELFKKIEEAQRNIQEYPDEACKNLDPALKDIEKLTKQQLISLQSTVEEELRNLSHNIDKNASEIFSRMHEAVEGAKTTMKALDKDVERINRLKQNWKNALQKQVYEDLAKINRLFKDIVKKFMSRSQIELVLITENEEYSVDEAKDVVDLDDLIGMSVKFSEFEDLPAQTMNELSGGQKAVIALAFMIAFQKHFAVTVILLDEVDQDLDVSYRHFLRNILKEVASKSQVFITTFRPEFLEVGKHFYQVEKAGPTSNISKISKVQALEFLKSVKEG